MNVSRSFYCQASVALVVLVTTIVFWLRQGESENMAPPGIMRTEQESTGGRKQKLDQRPDLDFRFPPIPKARRLAGHTDIVTTVAYHPCLYLDPTTWLYYPG